MLAPSLTRARCSSGHRGFRTGKADVPTGRPPPGYFGADALTWLFIGSLAFSDVGGNSSDEATDSSAGSDGDGGGFLDGGDY